MLEAPVVLQVVESAEPPNIQRLAVVVVVGIYLFSAADLTWQASQLALTYGLVHEVMCSRDFGPYSLRPQGFPLCPRQAFEVGESVNSCLIGSLAMTAAELPAAALHFAASSHERLLALAAYGLLLFPVDNPACHQPAHSSP